MIWKVLLFNEEKSKKGSFSSCSYDDADDDDNDEKEDDVDDDEYDDDDADDDDNEDKEDDVNDDEYDDDDDYDDDGGKVKEGQLLLLQLILVLDLSSLFCPSYVTYMSSIIAKDIMSLSSIPCPMFIFSCIYIKYNTIM